MTARSRPGSRARLQAINAPQSAPELPIDVHGTAFQEAVWQRTAQDPAGRDPQLCRYRARRSAIPTPRRAVGTANGSNPIAVLVPCHRVIRSDGTLGGYAGGLDRKKKLLAAEGAIPPAASAGPLAPSRRRQPSPCVRPPPSCLQGACRLRRPSEPQSDRMTSAYFLVAVPEFREDCHRHQDRARSTGPSFRRAVAASGPASSHNRTGPHRTAFSRPIIALSGIEPPSA